MAKTRDEGYRVVPYPSMQRLVADIQRIAHRQHTIHGLLEVDVTKSRQYIRAHKATTGETLSFTAFVTACLGRAVDMNKHMHAVRNWRNQLVIFDDVDVSTIIEVEIGGHKTPMYHIVRAANKKTFRDIHDEIRSAQSEGGSSQEASFWRVFSILPGFVRMRFQSAVLNSPRRRKAYHGTVMMTAVGMFGKGGGWGIPLGHLTLIVTLGGISEKPGVIDGRIEIREYLSVTVSFDHDIIDGAPAARFTQRLKELIEDGYGLIE